MKKKLTVVLAAALALTMLSGCSKARPLPDGFDQDEVADAAHVVVAQLVDGEYQAVADAFRDDMQQTYSITAQTIEDLMATVEEAGAYVATEETLVLGGSSKDFDEPYAAIAVYCEHENKDIVYEMSMDINLDLIGLAAKQK